MQKYKINAVSRLIKQAPKKYPGLFKIGEKFYASDRKRVYRTKEDIPELPYLRGISPNFDFEKIFDDASSGKIINDSIPAVKSVEAFSKFCGRGSVEPFLIFTPEFLYLVNHKYLLDILRAFPKADFYQPKSPTSPLYFKESVSGFDGLLMPIRTGIKEQHVIEKFKKKLEEAEAAAINRG